MLNAQTLVRVENGLKAAGAVKEGEKILMSNGEFEEVVSIAKINRGGCCKVQLNDNLKTELILPKDNGFIFVEKATGETLKVTAQEIKENNLYNEIILPQTFITPSSYNSVQDFKNALGEAYVDPWVLGFWLGDGTSQNSTITTNKDDVKYIVERFNRARYNTSRVKPAGDTGKTVHFTAYGLITQLGHLGLKGYKHIPLEYLTAPIEIRMELLRGLMDSDGYVTSSGVPTIALKEGILPTDVYTLLKGLGFKTTYQKYQQSLVENGVRRYLDTYRIIMSFECGEDAVSLERKLERITNRETPYQQRRNYWISSIVDIPDNCSFVVFKTKGATNMYGKEPLSTHMHLTFCGR